MFLFQKFILQISFNVKNLLFQLILWQKKRNFAFFIIKQKRNNTHLLITGLTLITTIINIFLVCITMHFVSCYVQLQNCRRELDAKKTHSSKEYRKISYASFVFYIFVLFRMKQKNRISSAENKLSFEYIYIVYITSDIILWKTKNPKGWKVLHGMLRYTLL